AEHIMDVETEFRLGPFPAAFGLEQLLKRYHLRMKRVLLAQGVKARFFEQAFFGFDIHIRFEEADISFSDRRPFEALVNLRVPFLRWLLEHREMGLVAATPQTGASTHDRAHRTEVGWAHEKANPGWPKLYLR